MNRVFLIVLLSLLYGSPSNATQDVFPVPLGPQPAADSLPVTMAPDQPPIAISGTVTVDGIMFVTTGSCVSPVSITASGGITTSNAVRQMIFVKGSSGAVDITVNPQVSAGTVIGQELVIKGCSDTDTLKIEDGNGLQLNGFYTLVNGSKIYLTWDGTTWGEVTRNDI